MSNEINKQEGVQVVKVDVMPPEIDNMLKLAKFLFESGMFPDVKSVAGVLATIEFGRELGIPPVLALNNIRNIRGRLTISSQLMLGLAVKNGVSFIVQQNDDRRCSIQFYKGKTVVVGEFEIEDARRAGLIKPDSGWVNYPRDMLWVRAVSRGIKKIDPLLLPGVAITEIAQDYANEAEEIPPIILKDNKELTPYDWKKFYAKMAVIGHSSVTIHEFVKSVYGFDSLKDYIKTGKTLEDLEAELLEEKSETTETPDLW